MPGPREKMETYVTSWFRQLQKPKNTERGDRNRPFITISRECGAYGKSIADRLVEHLRKRERRPGISWAVLDKELARKVIEEHNLPVVFERYFAQSSASRIQDILDDLFGVHPPQATLVREMGETVLHLASLGHVILVGQGAAIITRSLPNGTHVRFVGSLDKRVAHVMEHLNLPEKKAREYVRKEDNGRRDYIKRYFKADISDPHLYDVTINTDMISLEQMVTIIGDMVFLPKIRERQDR